MFARHDTPEIHERARQSDPHGRRYQRRGTAMAKEMHGDVEFEVTVSSFVENLIIDNFNLCEFSTSSELLNSRANTSALFDMSIASYVSALISV